MAALLEVKNLRAGYGPTEVLHGIDLAIEEGTITTLLGANGAGKTTTLRALCSMVKTSGEVLFAGKRIDGCATEGEDRDSTWINPEIRRLYGELFRRGYVHTVEVWAEGELVGGLYGLSMGAAFFGESMFHRVTDASKIAMAHLVERLKAGGYRLLDTQFVTPHLASLGGIEIPRELYEVQLAAALAHPGDFFALDRQGGPTG